MQIPGFSKSLKSRAKLTYVMEELAKTRIKASLLLFLIHFVSSSFSYDVPKKYFINCGSDRTVYQTSRSFNGDEERSSSVFFTKQNTSVASSNRSAEDIYGTARIFRQQSSYAFETSDPNPSSMYIVRLHFLAFRSSDYDLSSAIFDVSTSSGILLHHGFSGNESAKQPLVKEFFVTVKSARFRIYLTPRGSSIAFLNAVEFFPAPPLEFGDDKVNGQKMFQSPPVLQTIYRINVGGDEIDDDLWRNWNSDDAYLQNKDSSTNTSSSGQLHYSSEDARFAAPDSVYETARRMKNSVSLNSIFKINWSFKVNKSSRHVVRAHFCDIISTNKETLYFNFYIKDNLELPNYNIPELAQPMYADFNVDKESSGVLRISIGPSTMNEGQDAILNGLEILEIKEDSALVPIERDSDTAAKSKAKTVVVVAGSVIGGLAVLVFLAAVFFVAAKRRKRKKSREEGSAEKSSWGQVAAVFGGGNSNSRVTEQTISGSAVSNLHLGLRISLSEIHSATRRFSPKLVIGKGGFGSVYKGTLRCGTRVAVKRSSGRESGQGIDEFQTEITVLSSIRHRHLVSLIGYCDERDEMILVYEFMENGTLREHLYGNSSSPKPCLSWKQRLEICIGSASGLNYLHKGSSGRIIHRDVKSTNILLDENMVAKVADFGLSKAGPPEEAETTHVSTVVKGTMGYLDPEYCQTNQLTEKSDVYSFGVVLLEVLCARAPINPMLPRDQINLAWWVMKCKSEGALIEAVDPAIRGEISANSLRKFGETAEKCLHAEGPERPAMSDVIWELEYALQLQRTPAPREPHEDSTAATASGFSAALVLPDPAQIPDFEDHSGTDTADFSDMSASEVFSQLRRDAAR